MKTLTLLNVPISRGVRYALKKHCDEVEVDYVVLYADLLTPIQLEEQKRVATLQGKMIIIEDE